MVPLTPWARSPATGEAVAGTLLFTRVIPRIVGAYISPSGPEPSESPEPDSEPGPDAERG